MDDRSGARDRHYQVSDAHLHMVDFLMNGEGIDRLLSAMDGASVSDVMINALPVMKKWDAVDPVRPLYYLADDSRAYWYSAADVIVARSMEALDPGIRRRFHPFVCGFNPTDRNAIDHIRRMIEWYPGMWEGIGEIITRHDDLTALTYGEQARANHVALDPVYGFAADHGLPVTIHSDVSSVWVREPLYLTEVEEAVRDHPGTTIVWAHVGISRRIEVPSLVPAVRRLLGTYPNMMVDLSWVVQDDYVAPGGVPDRRWVELVSDFPDRFMIGSDAAGHFDSYRETISRYYVLLDELPAGKARMVARENFLRILPEQGVVL
jgi:hypothetical protein